jgi:hypothetical protein
MEDEAKRLSSTYRRLTLLNWALVILLLASVYNVAVDMNLLGLKLSPRSIAREIVLIISANLGVVSVAVFLHASILRKIAIKARTDTRHPSFALSLIDRKSTAEFIMELSSAFISETKYESRARRLTGAIFWLFLIIVTLIQVLLYVLASVGIHVAIMVDIWRHPSLPVIWSHSIVVYCLALDIMSICYSLAVSTIPLRYRNSELFAEYISRLEKGPTEAQRYLNELVKKEASKRLGAEI